MNIPPIIIPMCQVAELSVRLDLADGNDTPEGYLEVKFVDEGAGYFMEISQEIQGHPIRLDPKQLLELGEWAAKVCDELDAERIKSAKLSDA